MKITPNTVYMSIRREVSLEPRDEEIRDKMDICAGEVMRKIRDEFGLTPVVIGLSYHLHPVTHLGKRYVRVGAYVTEWEK